MDKNTTIWSFLEPLLASRESMHLADISRKLKKSHASVRNYLNLLEKYGVLIKQTKGRLTLYSINYSNPLIIDCLSAAEKEKLLKKCMENQILKEAVSLLHKKLNEENKAVIFGSCAENSKNAGDIDVMITGKMNLEGDTDIRNFKDKFGIKIHIVNAVNLNAITETLKKEIFKKHLIIQGSEEVIKWMI